jgi:hypothetical protein
VQAVTIVVNVNLDVQSGRLVRLDGRENAWHSIPDHHGIAQVQPRQPAAFVKGSKEDAADAVATYTAAMKARSAAAAIGRTSPLRPKVCIWLCYHHHGVAEGHAPALQGNRCVSCCHTCSDACRGIAPVHQNGNGGAADLLHLVTEASIWDYRQLCLRCHGA